MGDNRQYETFYGIETNDWDTTFGTLSDHDKLLIKEYINEECSTTSNTAWSSTGTIFLYPHHIKKKYYIEGVADGHITFTSEGAGAESFVSNYRVSIIKVSSAATETTLAATSIVSVNDTISWDSGTGTGDYIKYPFWIDIWSEPQELGVEERLGIKIEWDIDMGATGSSTTAYLSHENWIQGEDFKITIPFLL